jgi:hypothetical protein
MYDGDKVIKFNAYKVQSGRPILHITILKLPGNAEFRVQAGSQSKAQSAVNDWSFISVATRYWLSD